MKRSIALLTVLAALTFQAHSHAAEQQKNKQIGVGLGVASSYPVQSFPYAMMAALEGTYHWKSLGLSILATATSSPKTNGTYWFGSAQGGYQQTFIEPRFYFSIFHVGAAIGLNLSQGTSGEVQSVLSYGPMSGIELPLGRFSIGVDARYLYSSGTTNPSPLSMLMMFRLMF